MTFETFTWSSATSRQSLDPGLHSSCPVRCRSRVPSTVQLGTWFQRPPSQGTFAAGVGRAAGTRRGRIRTCRRQRARVHPRIFLRPPPSAPPRVLHRVRSLLLPWERPWPGSAGSATRSAAKAASLWPWLRWFRFSTCLVLPFTWVRFLLANCRCRPIETGAA